LSTIISDIAKDEVAAGDGAFRTCKQCRPSSSLPLSKMKSFSRLPSGCKACARTPDGPL